LAPWVQNYRETRQNAVQLAAKLPPCCFPLPHPPKMRMNGPWRWTRAIGPGLLTACVVIGPGSILTSSKIGASQGYSKAWVVVLAVFFMMIYTSLAAKLGVVSQRSTGDLVSQYGSRTLAVVIGSGVFFISAAFQFGNNIGVHEALSTFVPFSYWIVILNGIALACMFWFRNLYRSIERIMTCMVGLMFLSFALNLWFAKPHLGQLLAGLVPDYRPATVELPMLGLVGTTFVITAAYYQAYLVRFKGWTEADLPSGMLDARISVTIMAVITLMIMSTAAAVLGGMELNQVTDVANQLQPLFGQKGRAIFCIGLFAAAFSSFIVNAMVGGFILSDALNLGDQPQQWGPRLLSAAVLLIGMVVAMFVIKTGVKPIAAIVAAQATTVLAAPLMAATLLWLTNMPKVMGKHVNGRWMNLAAGLGLLLSVAMSWIMATEKVWPALRQWFE
jgi:manganese transport protein